MNFQPQHVEKPHGRSSRSCYQFSLHATSLSRHMAMCTAGVRSVMLHASGTWPLTKPEVVTTRSNELLTWLGTEDLDLILKERRLGWYVERSNGAVKTAFHIQVAGKRGPGRPKDMEASDRGICREQKLSAINPHNRYMWRSGARSAMRAASQLAIWKGAH